MSAISSTKPQAWTLSPQMTAAPELWRGCVAAVPFWESAGTALNDVMNNQTGTLNSMPWVLSKSGRGARLEGNGPDFTLSPGLPFTQPNLDNPTNSFSFAIVLVPTAYVGGNPGITRTSGNFFITNGGSGLWLRFDSVDIFKTSDTLPVDSVSVFSMSYSPNSAANGTDRATGYINGEQVANVSGHGAGMSTDSSAYWDTFGWQNAKDERVEGDYLALFHWDGFLSQEKHHKIGTDPFAMLRPAGF